MLCTHIDTHTRAHIHNPWAAYTATWVMLMQRWTWTWTCAKGESNRELVSDACSRVKMKGMLHAGWIALGVHISAAAAAPAVLSRSASPSHFMHACKMHEVVFLSCMLLAHSLRSREQERPDRSQERDVKYDGYGYDYDDDDEIEKLAHIFFCWTVVSAFRRYEVASSSVASTATARLLESIRSLPNWQKLQTITIHSTQDIIYTFEPVVSALCASPPSFSFDSLFCHFYVRAHTFSHSHGGIILQFAIAITFTSTQTPARYGERKRDSPDSAVCARCNACKRSYNNNDMCI